MKKMMILAVAALAWTACGNKVQGWTSDGDSAEVEIQDSLVNTVEVDVRETDTLFDINKYVDEMVEKAMVWYSKRDDDVRLIAYTLIDIDGDGLSREGFTFVKNSREDDTYFHENKFNIFSEEQEEIHDIRVKNGEDCSEEEWARAEQLLGDTITVTPIWHPIERKMKLLDYAE